MIDCIHQGKKIKIKIKYFGKPKILNACSECVDNIKSTQICEVIP